MGLAECLLYMRCVLCDWDGDRGGVDGLVEGGGGGCHSQQSVFVVSLSFPLSGSPFCCLPVHSVVSLFILLARCSFCCLPVHSIVSLSILLSPCPFCCIPVHSVVLQRGGQGDR